MRPATKVKDVMTTRRVVPVKPDDDVAFAARLMSWAGGEGGLDPVSRFMASPAETISPDDPITAASALMLSRRLGCLPVVAEGQLVGIITANDLMAADVRAAAPRLSLDAPISGVMTPSPVVVHAYEPLLEAVALMAQRAVRHVPVTDGEGRLVGMVTDRDVRTAIGDPAQALREERTEVDELLVSTVMTTPAKSVDADGTLAAVAERLTREPIGALPVVDRAGRVTGIVSYVDVVRALLDLAGTRSLSAHAS